MVEFDGEDVYIVDIVVANVDDGGPRVPVKLVNKWCV